GGNGGAQPRHADLLAADVDEATVVRLCDRFLMYYIHTPDPLERTARWIERLDRGIAYLPRVIVHDALGLSPPPHHALPPPGPLPPAAGGRRPGGSGGPPGPSAPPPPPMPAGLSCRSSASADRSGLPTGPRRRPSRRGRRRGPATDGSAWRGSTTCRPTAASPSRTVRPPSPFSTLRAGTPGTRRRRSARIARTPSWAVGSSGPRATCRRSHVRSTSGPSPSRPVTD